MSKKIAGFHRADRTYYLSDDRMAIFRALTIEERLSWVEEFAAFVHCAQEARKTLCNSREYPQHELPNRRPV